MPIRLRASVPSRWRVVCCIVAGVVLLLVAPGVRGEPQPRGARDGAPAPTWFRVFMRDGQVLSVLGESTRVGDDVIVQVPTAEVADGAPAATRAVTIAAGEVDWVRTEAYRDAARRAQFEAAGGARAYAAFTEDVAATLRDVAALADPLERIARLEAARARLAQWPAAHHGYRAADVAETLSVVDDLLHGMRAAAGQQTFTLAITSSASPVPPASPPLLPAPTLQEVVAQAMGLAGRVGDPAERLALLQAASSMLASGPGLNEGWARDARAQVRRSIRQEQRVSSAYERLRSWMLGRTTRLVAMADVRGLMRLRGDVRERDAKLRQQRPAEVAALLATLDVHLETARRHRLLLERWQERRPELERYAAVLQPHVASKMALAHALEEIKALSGPDAALLARAEGQLAASRADAGRLAVPDEARAVQQLWLGAQQLAARALQARRVAVRTGDMRQAWEASAAAAGALMLHEQVRADAAALVRPPAIPVSVF